MNKKIKRLGVYTSYKVKGNNYSSYILGDNTKEINRVIDLRSLDETKVSIIQHINHVVPDLTKLSDKKFIEKLPQIIHTCCFLSFIAMKSKLHSIEDILGDQGVLHDLTHLLVGCKPGEVGVPTIREMKEKLKILQSAAIGLYK